MNLLELLAHLASLDGDLSSITDGDIAAHEAALLDGFDAVRAGDVDGIAPDDTTVLGRIRDAVAALRVEADTRLTAAAERAEEIAAIEADLRPAPEPDPEPVAEADPAPEAVAEVIAEAEAATAEAAQPEPVVAAAPAPAITDLAARSRVPAVTTTPRAETAVRLLAEGRDVGLREFAEAIIDQRDSFGAYPGLGEQRVRLGRMSWSVPDAASLDPSDAVGNAAKMDAITAAAQDPANYRGEEAQAIVASGGFCAPTETLYDIAQISGAQRPVRDGLARLGAGRGGYRWVTPPDLSDVLVDQSGGAVGEWTNTTDITPGQSVKTTQTVPCPGIVESIVEAIYKSIQFGNFQSRAFPELVQTWVANTAAAHARKAEGELLTAIAAASTPITTAQVFGTTRDLLAYAAQLLAAERNRQRMQRDARMRVMFPAWIVEAIQQDIIRQGNIELRIPTEADIRSWFNAVGASITFYEDTANGAGQIVSAQGAGNDLRNLPGTVEWYAFPEGSHFFLDGGVLDLGQVRDSTLNETNDYRLFAETFEGHAFRGIWSYKVRSAICSSGEAQVPTDQSSTICASS